MQNQENCEVMLYYGWQECEDGIYHAFSLEDPENCPPDDDIVVKLARLLDTTPKDMRFGWNSMYVQLPNAVVERIRNSGMKSALHSLRPMQPKKEYTIDSFRRALYVKPIKVTGRVASSSDGKDCINYSSILTKLIQLAGRHVDSYASDMIITWNTVIRDLDYACGEVFYGRGDTEFYKNSYLFGFREHGVDHTTSVLARFNNAGPHYYGKDYRELWRLDMSVARTGEVKMELYKLDKEA